jgi:hypothetical protein
VVAQANWPRVPDTTGIFVSAVVLLRQALIAAGVGEVQIIGPESSNADGTGLAGVKACQQDRACWAGLDSIASHSYGMAANAAWANATAAGGVRKGYWMTEAGAFSAVNQGVAFPGLDGEYQGVALASRFLNDLNHMVDTWVWFIGAWIFDRQMIGGNTTRQEDMKLISTCPTKAAGGKPCYADAPDESNGHGAFQLMPQWHYMKQ